jgi:tetratricopeptide (TPR) repeat protein
MRAYVARMAGRLEDALGHVDRALALEPHYSHALSMRVRVLTDLRRFADARATLEAATVSRPNWPVMVEARATLDLLSGRYAEAETGYTELMKVWGDLGHTWNARAEARIMLGKLDEAERDIDQAERLSPKDVQWMYNRASLAMARGDAKGALDIVDRAFASTDVTAASALDLRGRALMELKRPDEALKAFDAAIAMDPTCAPFYANRGEVFVVRKQYDRALADVDRALALGPETAEVHQNRAQVLRRMGRNDEAHAALDKALAMKADLRLAMESKARWCAEDERFPEALAATDRILRLEPRNAFWLVTKGAILANMGKLKDALAAYRAAIDADPTWTERVADDVKMIEEALRKRDE